MTFDLSPIKNAGDILVVDDTVENLQFLNNILTQAGYHVRLASDGELALRTIQVKPPILIVLDIRMPGMDGFEVCRRLKAHETTREIPVIFVSALSDSAEKIKGFALGAVDYITKPFNAQEILMRIATHFSLFAARQQLSLQHQQLQEAAELRYRMVADFTYAWETWISPSGEWLYCSPSCLRITGYEAAAFISNPQLLLDITHPDERHCLDQHLTRHRLEPFLPPQQLQFRIHRADGREVWLEHVCQAISDSQGTYLGRRASNRDITEQKQAEAFLIQAKLAAEAANIAKSTFIATMSHELRTPLNAIMGFSELMSQDDTLNSKQKETLAIINRSGTHLLSVINNILDISNLETGRMELEIQACDLLKLLEDVSQTVDTHIEHHRLAFKLNISPPFHRYIKTDSNKLHQILLNVLGNAIKFTQQGEIILHADTQVLNATELLLNIAVIDSGCGIPAELLPNLFKPFVQLLLLNNDTEGTGLGLAISKFLLDLMGGQISVSSELGKGSTFNIQLPVKSAVVSEVCLETQWQPVKGLAANQPDWRLLVVDDNADNRFLLVKILTDVGFQVHEAENGQEAISEFEQWHPHVILMDMRMPVLDGYQATLKIRQMPNGTQVKIIAVTASAFTAEHKHIIKSGCDGIIQKPFHIPEVFAALSKHLGVEFIYQNTVDSTAASLAQQDTAEVLSSLPAALRQELYQAALNLDVEETSAVIEKLSLLAPQTAQHLQNLLQTFQFDQIIQLADARLKVQI